MKVGIFGAGFSGKEIGRSISDEKHEVWGTTRSEEKFPRLREVGIVPIAYDGTELNDDLRAALLDTTHLIISIAPSRQENTEQPDEIVDPVLRGMQNEGLKTLAPKLQWVGYLSTVGVYGNHDGAWIDETTPAAPASERSRQRVRAEAEWLAIGEALNVPIGIFRLSGIYGPGRNALLSADKGKARRLVKKDQVFNRIHVGDIATALNLAAGKNSSGLFNITDNEPAPPQDVVKFAHELMGKNPPEKIDFETAELTPMARSFYGENKRVSNSKSKSELGFEYAWPNYRSALTRMWTEDRWRS